MRGGPWRGGANYWAEPEFRQLGGGADGRASESGAGAGAMGGAELI